MFDALMKIFNKQEPSGKVAKDRLKVVLIHDRANVSPELMEQLKRDIIHVISNYMEINQNDMEISLAHDADSAALMVNVPVSKMIHHRGH